MKKRFEEAAEESNLKSREIAALERTITLVKKSQMEPESPLRGESRGVKPRSPGPVTFDLDNDPVALRKELERLRASVSTFKADSRAKMEYLRKQLEEKEEVLESLRSEGSK